MIRIDELAESLHGDTLPDTREGMAAELETRGFCIEDSGSALIIGEEQEWYWLDDLTLAQAEGLDDVVARFLGGWEHSCYTVPAASQGVLL